MQTYLNNSYQYNRQIAIWLMFIALLVFCMVMLGGVTRLTGSGLSMVDWKPLTGIIPPLNETEWQAEFDNYKQYPQYQKVNHGMSLSEFKQIFAFEYGHRLLGRLVGLAYFFPFLFFLFSKRIPAKYISHLSIIFILGALQGLLGWYMVKSGLAKDPHVSQYRLAAHLISATVIYIYALWVAWSLLYPHTDNNWIRGVEKLKKLTVLVSTVVVLMIISGAFVAGTRAGYVFNTFPLMDKYFIPPGLFALEPFYVNFTENIATVQFIHRMIAYTLIILIPLLWFQSHKYALKSRTRLAFNLLLLAFCIQIGLGITTLLLVVPVPIAALHQAGAIIVLTIIFFINHELRASQKL